jgi:hypothetical protein
MRALVSLVVAVIGSIAGHLLLWGGGTTLYQNLLTFRTDPVRQALPSVFVVLGLLFLAAAMLSAAWSSLGVIIVGLFHVVAGLAVVVLPVAMWARALTSVESISRPVGQGLENSWSSGVGLLTGVVFLVGGIALAGRRARPGAAGRAVTTVLALLLGVGVVLLLAYGGERLLVAIQQLRGVEVLGVGFVILAALALAVVVAGVRWSSLGVILFGGLLLALGTVALWSTVLVRLTVADRHLASGVTFIGGTGGYLALGVLVLVTGIAGVIRGRRRRAVDEQDEVDERIGYQQEQSSDPAPSWPPFPTESGPRPTAAGRPPEAPPADRV